MAENGAKRDRGEGETENKKLDGTDCECAQRNKHNAKAIGASMSALHTTSTRTFYKWLARLMNGIQKTLYNIVYNSAICSVFSLSSVSLSVKERIASRSGTLAQAFASAL